MTPEKIGKYRVIELLGRGGMGEVYLGEDPYIGRRVAIKMIKGADPGARDRFIHEARVIGGLTHPAIVSLIDFDFSGDEPFLVMELLTGKGLDAWIREAHPLREKLVIVEDLCQALAFAHENGVLHRDVKPSNVQVLANGHAKLMDFGIARGGAARLTATGAVMGTPEYMAPEILRDASYSAQSDVYACAVLLYEMFTGENPFAGKTVAATLTNVLTATAPDLGSVRDDVPDALSAAVMACLRKEPEARPADFAPLLAAVREALAAPARVVPETRAIATTRAAVVSKAPPARAGEGVSKAGRWFWAASAAGAMVVAWFLLRPPVPAPEAPAARPETAETVPTPNLPAPAESTPGPETAARDLSGAKGPARALVSGSLESAAALRRGLAEATVTPPVSRTEAVPVPTPVSTPPANVIALEPSPQATVVADAIPLVRPTVPAPLPPAAVSPSMSSVSPRSIRRGSSVVLEVRGDRLRPDMNVKILQGRRPAVGIRVVRVEFVSPLLLRVTVLSEAELPLGGYTLVLQDATGASVPGLQIEVVL